MHVGQRFLKNSENGPLYFIGQTIDRSSNSDAALYSGSERDPFDERLHGLFQAKAVELRRRWQVCEGYVFLFAPRAETP